MRAGTTVRVIRKADWKDLGAEAILEPAELHGWERPASSDVRLMLFVGGPLLFDADDAGQHGSNPTVREGDLILRSGSEPYVVGWKSLTSAPTRSLVVHLDRDFILRTAEELDGCNPDRLILESRLGFRDPLLREICLALWRELENPGAGKLYLQTVAQMLAVHLLRRYAAPQARIAEFPHVLTQRQLRSVTDLVVGNPGSDLSLGALATQAGLSPYHFARLFRATTGASPHQFVLTQRLEKARHLLQDTSLSLAEVALDAGFANQSHFHRAFKHRFGCTPRVYREKAG